MYMVTFITFGNINYMNSLKRIRNEAKNMKIFDNILTLNERDLENRCPIFWDSHKDFILKNPRGYGYWLWKPFIILKTLESMNDNDILLYSDAGCSFNKSGLPRMYNYLNIVKNNSSGVLSFQLQHNIKNYTKMDLLDYLGMNNTETLNSKMLVGGIIFFRKCENTIKLVNEWYKISCNYHLIDDTKSILTNDISFIEHRHDQSVLSLLIKKYGANILSDETYFNYFNIKGKNYPIWATRLK